MKVSGVGSPGGSLGMLRERERVCVCEREKGKERERGESNLLYSKLDLESTVRLIPPFISKRSSNFRFSSSPSNVRSCRLFQRFCEIFCWK